VNNAAVGYDYDNYNYNVNYNRNNRMRNNPVGTIGNFNELIKLTDEMLYKTWPTVAGFSFAAKAWGEIFVANLSEIVFDDDAYDRLVLADDKKQLIRALVEDNQINNPVKQAQIEESKRIEKEEEEQARALELSKSGDGDVGSSSSSKSKKNKNKDKKKAAPQQASKRVMKMKQNTASFTDIISGKGGGVIFLLHGPPGVGKTLTAEAIAEFLHCPLYSVSVGELGTSTEQLEHQLQDILELASIWSAVTLIDEADIFLEARTNSDILRNAMVGIFLRKLEYHQGVLFLTTNRVGCFDPAFNSRISVSIHYEELKPDARSLVWKNLVEAALNKARRSNKPEDEDEEEEDAKKKKDKEKEDEEDEEQTKKILEDINADKFSKYQLNGRQIRTAIRLGIALARSEDKLLNSSHVERTIAIMQTFDKEMDVLKSS